MAKDMIRRDPFDVFHPFFHLGGRWNRMLIPAMDVSESEDALAITAELPGIDKDEVKIK